MTLTPTGPRGDSAKPELRSSGASVRRWSPVVGVALAGLLLTGAAWWFLLLSENRRIEAAFQQRAALQIQFVRERLQLHAELVRGVRAYIEHSSEVRPDEFSDYVRQIVSRLPATRAVQWAPRVPAGQRTGFERAQAAIHPGFRIWEREQPGVSASAAIPARPGDEHWPIAWIEPLESNKPALGFDLHASAPTRSLLDQARSTGRMHLSPQVQLISSREVPRGYGIIFMEPVFRPADPHAAADGFAGFVQAIFGADQLIAGAQTEEHDSAVDIAFYDDSAENPQLTLLYACIDGAEFGSSDDSHTAALAELAARPHATRRMFRFGERSWRLVVAPNIRWLATQRTALPGIVLASLLALTTLALLLVRGLVNRTARIEQLVAERTAELAESRRLLASLLSDMPGIAYRCDGKPPYTPLFVSDGITRLCGLKPEDMTSGRIEWAQLVHPDDAATHKLIFTGVKNREPYEREYRILHTDGSWRWVWERGHGVFDANGQLLSLEGLIVDATARKATEEHTREFDRQLLETQKLESLGILAGGIAHDFNNILTAILGNASLARFDLPPDSPLRPQLEQIEVSSRRAADLCAKLLAYAGRGSLAKSPVNLSALVQDTATLLEVSINKSTRLHLQLAPALPPLDGDATQLRQIMVNLVLNASEAIGNKSGEIELSTFVREATADELRQAVQAPALPGGTYVGLEVRDNGSGIPPELIARIFEPFFTTKFSGRGLGLSAVLGIVRSHHGALFVESRPQEGSCFRVLLPAATAGNATSPLAIGSTAVSADDFPALEGTVLIVDDEDSVRDTAARALRSSGLEVIEASNGLQALDLCRKHPEIIDLILLDLTMPELSGEETLRRLRQQGTTQKVILMSGYTASEATQRCQQLGAVAFMPKPFEVVALAKLVAAHLKR